MKSIFLKCLNLLVVFSTFLVTSGCSFIYHHYPFNKVRDIRTLETRLQQAVSNSSRLKMEIAGQVEYLNYNLPIWLVTYTPSTQPSYRVFVSAGIHGNEPAGVEAVVSLIEEIGQDKLNLSAVQIEFMPLLNPWGWVRNLKWNGDAIDVNRKFIKVVTQESTIIKKIICKKRYDITIDLHEDGRYDGFYCLTYDNPNSKTARELASTIAKKGFPLREFKGQTGFIHISRSAFKDLSRPTLAFYCRLNATEKAYLFETPFDRKFEDRTYLHKTSILYLLDSLSEDLIKINSKNNVHNNIFAISSLS